ncbi:MAG TPA: MauE/DoxX family redox-associated membrane protein [Streptosporangiaceae bacterium]|nr:MauE/DoxX family redox-associated membrane protein [Streptosporangiaceae bacterium]
MISAIREVQAPLLAVILLAACATKLYRVLRVRSVWQVLGATALFPPKLRRPATMALCMTELFLGISLIVTAGQAGVGGWATGVRLATACLFLVGMCALAEMRERRPDLGCGCFGDFSSKPPGMRSIARAGLLTAATVASVGVPPLELPSPGGAALGFGIVLAELLVLAFMSPEVGEALQRLGYSAPCELRSFPAYRARSCLRRSRAWRRYSAVLVSDSPADMWRELCWWYAVYPAHDAGQDCAVVFAVEVKPHRPAIRAVMVPRSADEQQGLGQPAGELLPAPQPAEPEPVQLPGPMPSATL